MASLVKPYFVAYVLADGTKVKAGTPGARKKRTRSKVWYRQFKDPMTGRWKREKLLTVDGRGISDKSAARIRLGEIEKKAERDAITGGDPFEVHRKTPLVTHLADYRRYLEAEGNCAEYVIQACARIQAILTGCEFTFIADMRAEKVAEYLHSLRRDPPRPNLEIGKEEFTPKELVAALGGQRPPRLARLLRREGLATISNGRGRRYPRATVERLQDFVCRGIGISTSNGYLTAIKGFSNWLVEKERTDRDRMVSLSRLNAKTDLRHLRRALPEEELQAILRAASDSTIKYMGLTGLDRCSLYAVAMVTGYRASELASMVPASFDLDTEPPTATVRAGYTKNKREACQPLPRDFAEALRVCLADKPSNRAVWPGKWRRDAAELLRLDLAAAGIAYRDAEGAVADFHALRHSYISLLARSGVHPKIAQDLARHSDIRLTMNAYTHMRLRDLAGAVQSMPALLPLAGPNECQSATGTGGPISDKVSRACTRHAQTPEELCLPLVTHGEGDAATSSITPMRKSLDSQAFGDDWRSMVTGGEELPGQDSNLDKENQNLLCYRYTTG